MAELGERERRERREEREREETSTYYNKLINNSQKTYLIKSFSFPNIPDITVMFDHFEQVARMEGVNKSQLYIRAMQEFLQRHPLPNPQSQIDRMLEVQMPHKPANQCCVQNCRGKAKFLLRLKDFEGKQEEFLVCEGHKNWRHQRFRFIISYRPLVKG